MQKLKPCILCGKPVHLIPMKTGEFKCRGYVAQCTSEDECNYSLSMSDVTWSEAVKRYNERWAELNTGGFTSVAWPVLASLGACSILGATYCTMAVFVPWSEAAKYLTSCIISIILGLAIGMALAATKR